MPRERGLPERGAPLADIGVLRSGRGSESCSAEIGAPPSAFGVERPASRPGDPCGSAAAESASRVLEREPVRGRAFASGVRPGSRMTMRGIVPNPWALTPSTIRMSWLSWGGALMTRPRKEKAAGRPR